MVNGKRKGNAGESELASFIGDRLGVQLRRGRQGFGGHVEPDVCGLPGWWVEAKREEKPSLRAWLRRVIVDLATARSSARPLLCWRPNRGIWWAVLRLEDWCALEARLRLLERENTELRFALGEPPRPTVVDAGPRQRTLDECLMENE